MSQPQIVYVCEYGTANGGERSLLAWLPHVVAAGFDVAVVAPPGGPFAVLLHELNVPVMSWPTELDESANKPADRRDFLADVIRKAPPDLIHANSLSMSRVAGPVAAEQGVTGIGHLRDIVRLSRQATRDLNRNARVLAVSQATADWHVAQGLSADKTHVLYNGIDLHDFAPRQPTGYLHDELNLPPATRLVGAAGQLGMRKGLDVLLTAVSEIVPRFPDLHLLLIGERTSGKDEAVRYEQQLRATAAAPLLAGRVHFLGYRHDMSRLLNELTLLVHAARQEPLGRVLLEAAAAGVPIVATDVGGTREILEDNHGAIVPPDDSRSLAEKITALLNAPDVLNTQAAAVRDSVKSRFDIHKSAAELLRHYRALL